MPGNQVREFLIHGNFTEVDGFEISEGDEGIYGDGTFKCATNNLIHDTGGDGIAMNCSDYSTIYSKMIHDCGKFATYCGSGISFYEAIASDSQSGFHNWVSHNSSFDNSNIGITNCHNSNGIIFDDSNNTQNGCALSQPAYTQEGLVEENLAYGNGGVGIKPYQTRAATSPIAIIQLSKTRPQRIQMSPASLLKWPMKAALPREISMRTT